MRDRVLTLLVLKMWQERLPNAATVEIDDPSRFLQEDAPERILAAIEDFSKANAAK